MRGLKGKKAIVTGGAQGIGRACVEAFLEHGVEVTFGDLEAESAVKAVEEMSAKGKVHAIVGDMAEEQTCIDLVNQANERMGGIDFLVNNAFSFTAAGPQATREEWQGEFDSFDIVF